MKKNINALLQMNFPEDSPFKQRPANAKDLAWNNHLNSLVGMICELKSAVKPAKKYT